LQIVAAISGDPATPSVSRARRVRPQPYHGGNGRAVDSSIRWIIPRLVELAGAAGLQSHHPAVFTALADANGFARGSRAKFASGNGRARVRHHAGWTANDESWQFVYAI